MPNIETIGHVGNDLIVAKTVNVHSPNGVKPELPAETIKKLRSLIDRSQHSSALCDAIQNRLGEGGSRPLVCVIPGFDIDRHEYFVKRYTDEIVETELNVAFNTGKLVRSCSHRYEKLAWPADISSIEQVVQHAYKAICTVPMDAEQKAESPRPWFKRLFSFANGKNSRAKDNNRYPIVEQFYRLGIPFSFRYRVTENCWDKNCESLLTEWINYWRTAPDIESDYFFAIIICLVYPDDPKHPATKSMQEWVEKIRRQQLDGSDAVGVVDASDVVDVSDVVVLDDLPEIFWKDADAWIYNYVQDEVANIDTEDLRRYTEKIFETGASGKRLGAICENIKKALNQAYNA